MTAGAQADPAVPAPDSQPHPNRLLLYTLIGFMQFFWSANFLVGKIALREFPAPLLAGLRVLVAALFILPFYRWKVHGRGEWTRRDLPLLALLGFIGVGMNQVLFVLGLSNTTVAHSAFMIGMTPVWVLLMAAARGLERITVRKLGGMLAALSGVAVLSLERSRGPGPTLTGDLLTLLAGSAFALYTIAGKEVNHRYSSLTVTTFLFGFGALFLLPLVVWQGFSFRFAAVSVVGWLALVYMSVFPSLVCYLIFYYALGYVSASRLSTLSYLQPVVAAASGALLLGERLSAPLVVGGAIIFGGVYLTERG